MAETQPESAASHGKIFATTHWSVVLSAGEGATEASQLALEKLCHAYWYPIYVFVRRKGHGADDAQDLTQEFFAQILAKELLRVADRGKGRFRNFLLGALDNFLAREWSRAHRQKRGGHYKFVSLDAASLEERYRLEPADHDTPERRFTRQWALTVLGNALAALERECAETGKSELFGVARPLLSGEPHDEGYAALGERLAMSEGAARLAVHRLRRRYGELLRAEIAETVDSASEAEDELRELIKALRG